MSNKPEYYDFELTEEQFLEQRSKTKHLDKITDIKKNTPYLVFWKHSGDIQVIKHVDHVEHYTPNRYFGAIFTVGFVGHPHFMDKVEFVNPELSAKHTSHVLTIGSYANRWFVRRIF